MALSKQSFTDTYRERRKAAKQFLGAWRKTAQEEFAFISGHQWLPEDEAKLTQEKRPPITFNYSEKMIDAVVGAEVGSRSEVTLRPRGVEDSGAADLMNAAAKWVNDECNGEDEDSDAFRDMLICGLGWTQTRMDYSEDQEGKIVRDRIDPLEMWYDPAANKVGLLGRRYHFREWWVDKTEAEREFPKGNFSNPSDDATGVDYIQTGNRYNDIDDNDEQDRHKDQIRLTLYECVEHEPIWRVATEQGLIELSSEDFSKAQEALDMAGLKYAKQFKNVYYRGFFSGETLLEMTLSPCQAGFTFQAITGKRDRNKNVFYGLTRVMIDPQRWANKWLSQILHIVNSNAKGGLMAEIGAFVDPVKAREEWSSPDSITLFNEGALSGGKVQPKTMSGYPSGLDKLMQFALSSLPMVTGINLEALGLANREQAGILEQQRKQAAFGLLAPLFDALRRYRKNEGRIRLYFIKEFISDGRLIRVGGPDSQQYVPLTKQPDNIEYDFIVDQAPNAPDTKQQTWETLTAIVPNMLKAGMPLPPDLLDYAPIPTALATKWKTFIAQQPQQSPEVQQMQQQMQELQQQNQQLQQQLQDKSAETQIKAQQVQAELTMKQQALEAELALKRQAAEAEQQREDYKVQREMEIANRKQTVEADLKTKSAKHDLTIKSLNAGLKTPQGEGVPEKLSVALDSADLSKVVEKMHESTKQSNEVMLKAISSLADAISKPRKLIHDEKGRPIGSAPA